MHPGPVHALEFKPAMPSDRTTLVRLCAAYRDSDGRPAQPEVVASALRAALAGDPFIRIWMIRLRDRVVGYAAVTLGFSIEAGGRDAFLDELFVEAHARGQGIGTQTLRHLETECRKLGVLRINLEAERTNLEARAFYELNGFRDHERFLMSKPIL
jgi:GNAT superfamily N-acetyltransferase